MDLVARAGVGVRAWVIHYEIVLGLTREELVSDPATLDARGPTEMREALRLTAAEQTPGVAGSG